MKRRTIFVTAVLFILIAGNNHSSAQSAEELLPKAIQLEEVKGELEEAIEVYKTIVNDYPANRSVAAKAYFRLGMCYEKLGKEEAQNAYNTVVRNYADQEEVVTEAKARLVALRQTTIKETESDGLTLRQVWAPAGDTYGVSPDGRYLNYINWDAIAVAVRDLQTGKTWNISKTGTWEGHYQYPDISVWAPDSRQIAYYWFNEIVSELHISNLDGSEDRIIFKSEEHKYNTTPWPVAWSPDGKHLLAFNASGGENNPDGIVDQIVLVSVKDGSIRILKELDGLQCGCRGSFSPDNQYIAYSLQQEAGSEKNDIYILDTGGNREEGIIKSPAEDNYPLWTPDGQGIVFVSDRKGSTNLWTIPVINGNPQGEPEMVKSNLGSINLLGITDDESLFYGDYSRRRDVFIARLDLTSGKILSEPKKISSLDEEWNFNPAWSPDGRYVAYVTWPPVVDQVLGRRIVFSIYDTETGTDRYLKTDLHGIPWRGAILRPRWSPDGKFLLVHGDTEEDNLHGFFLVDVNTGERNPVLIKERGPKGYSPRIGILPVFADNGKDIYFLSEDRKSIIKCDISGKTREEILSVEHVIQQFMVSPEGDQIVFRYRDDSSNVIYSTSASGGDIQKLAEVQENTVPILISWKPDNKDKIYIIAYTSKELQEILSVPVKGGDPEWILSLNESLPQGRIVYIDVHPDGQHVAIDLVSEQVPVVWAMENLFKK